jgi:LPXTG-site transpeptidase (sortase) family protein
MQASRESRLEPRTSSAPVIPDHENEGAPASRLPESTSKDAHTPSASPGKSTPQAGKPRRLIISAIGVNAPVETVGMHDGAQEVPSSFSSTGWWRDGVMPGNARGNAVITGHTWSQGEGVFDLLPKLRRADTIKLRTTKGMLVFRVSTVTQVPVGKFADVAARVYRPSGAPGLVLLTCGDFDTFSRTYGATTIVFAELLG